MQYVILLDDRVVDILDPGQYNRLRIKVNRHNIIITKGEFKGCKLYEDEEHKFQQGSIQGMEFILLLREYHVQTELWKQEWLKNNPPTETVHHLTNPAENTKRRFDEWSKYVTHRAEKWWRERGWRIIWGSPQEGCRFEKLLR